MQVRNQVRRRLWSGYYTIFHRTPTCGSAQGLHVKKGNLFNEGDGVLQRILNAKRKGEGTSLWPSRFRRYTLSSRNAYSSKTPLFPKSTTSEVPPDENSCQVLSVSYCELDEEHWGFRPVWSIRYAVNHGNVVSLAQFWPLTWIIFISCGWTLESLRFVW